MTKKQEKELAATILRHRELYVKGTPRISDVEFDRLEDRLRALNPEHPALKRSLTPVNISTEDKELPYALPSLDKMRPDTGAEDWVAQNNIAGFMVTAKLDGLAGELIIKNGKASQLFSSSDDGFLGKDISHLLGNIQLPLHYKSLKNAVIRLELIIARDDFAPLSEKYKNPRNLATGIKNTVKGLHADVGILRGVALEILEPRMLPVEQFEVLKENGFEVPLHRFFSKDKGCLTNSQLSSTLIKVMTKSKFNVDGLVIEQNIVTAVPEDIPSHKRAFKDNSLLEAAIVTVNDVEWIPSRYNKLTPLVKFDPVSLDGSVVARATGHNAAFIRDNRIGVGAKIKIIKSGSIIPKVEEVIEQSKKSPIAALKKEHKVHWDKNRVQLYLDQDELNEDKLEEAKITALSYFITTIGVQGVRYNNVRKMYLAGHRDIFSLLKCREKDWVDCLGVNGVSIYASLQDALDNITYPVLAQAWAGFGISVGYKRLSKVWRVLGNKILHQYKKNPEVLYDKIRPVVGPRYGELLGSSMNDFYSFIQDLNKVRKVTVKEEDFKNVVTSTELADIVFVCTGFRDKELETKLIQRGAVQANSVSSKVNLVIAKDLNATGNKLTNAKKLGIKIITKDEADKL